jgi:xylan 1,4-beta-xylosidase
MGASMRGLDLVKWRVMLEVRKRKLIRDVVVILVGLASLPVMVVGIKEVVRWITRATGEPANIVVNRRLTLGEVDQFWRGVAQGAEREGDVFEGVEKQLAGLEPRWVRIDHVFDSYDLVDRDGEGELVFDFSRLDKTVKVILDAGGVPWFALSYTPKVMGGGGGVVDKPKNWQEWERLVEEFVWYFSYVWGIDGVYYEVWNEPDLFGQWRTKGEKNYLELYDHTARGAMKAAGGGKNFFLGGPATTGMYPNWIERLVDFAEENKLPLDFVSWHRYDKSIKRFEKDAEWVWDWKVREGKSNVGLYLTEWGMDSENHPGYDGKLAAAHLVAGVREMMDYKLDGVLTFELVDGKSPRGDEYWGRWGMVTHPEFGASEKPRYGAFQMLNQMDGERLNLSGEGTWVKGVAVVGDDEVLKLVLVNYDEEERNVESVPVSFVGLDEGRYRWVEEELDGKVLEFSEVVSEGEISRMVLMEANEVKLIILSREIEVTSVGGISGGGYDLTYGTGVPLMVDLPQGLEEGTVELWVKLEEGYEEGEILSLVVGGGRELAVNFSDEKVRWGLYLIDEVWSVAEGDAKELVDGGWHHLAVDWKEGLRLSIWIDGRLVGRYEGEFTSGLASPLMLPVSGMVIDELRVSRGVRYSSEFAPERVVNSDEQTVAVRSF